MQLIEVTDTRIARQFLEVNRRMNSNSPHYIRPLDKDIEEVFDQKKNKTFRFGKAIRWILVDRQGALAGRIAAFTNKKYKNKGDDVPVGGIGFFDCINDQLAADMLFDVARHWLLQQGMEAMDGPINFGERDRWWGLLTEGFEPPLYCMNFNPPYYKHLFEQYGFRPFFDQICFARKVHTPLQQKFFDRHAALAADPGFAARHVRRNNLDKIAEDFTVVYNKAWSGHGGLKDVNKEIVLKMFKKMKPVMDEKVIWFTYYKEEPIAMYVNLPDLNQWFKRLDGRFDLPAKLKFLWVKATVPCTRFVGVVFGVVPAFQNQGVDSFMVVEAAKIMQHTLPYQDYEMQWIGDFNPKMISIAETLDTYRSRKLVTYRYLFDRMKEFKRHPVV